jgi:hypothetical protein
MRGLTLHFYAGMLIFALRGLDELGFDVLHKVKTTILQLDSNMEVSIPEDCIDVTSVGIPINDKIRPMARGRRLNPMERGDDTFAKDELPKGLGPNLYDAESSFGLGVISPDSWIQTEDNKIRIDNRSGIKEIAVTYLTDLKLPGMQSVIHPFAQAALMSYMNWQWAIYTKDRDQELRRRDFYNDLRILVARKSRITTTEIKRIVRESYYLTVKN